MVILSVKILQSRNVREMKKARKQARSRQEMRVGWIDYNCLQGISSVNIMTYAM